MSAVALAMETGTEEGAALPKRCVRERGGGEGEGGIIRYRRAAQ